MTASISDYAPGMVRVIDPKDGVTVLRVIDPFTRTAPSLQTRRKAAALGLRQARASQARQRTMRTRVASTEGRRFMAAGRPGSEPRRARPLGSARVLQRAGEPTAEKGVPW
jgi:hypothetical protein